MVIIFSNDKARNHLLSCSHVFTARVKKRRDDALYPKFNVTALVAKRGGKKIRDVMVSLVGYMHVDKLGDYVHDSGFGSVNEWIDAIIRMNKGFDLKNDRVYLYHVILMY